MEIVFIGGGGRQGKTMEDMRVHGGCIFGELE